MNYHNKTITSLLRQLEPLQSLNGDLAVQFENRIESRAIKGEKEYGISIDKSGLSPEQLIEMALQELEDGMIYLKASGDEYDDVIERLYKIWVQIMIRIEL